MTRHLQEQTFDPIKEYYEILIKGKITAKGLKNLLALSYEVALTENVGMGILTTGTMHTVPRDCNYNDRLRSSRLILHTHVPNPDDISSTIISTSDIALTEFTNQMTTQVLVHSLGILIYQRPTFNPMKNMPHEECSGPWDLLCEYFIPRGIAPYLRVEGMREMCNLSPNERNVALRSFVEETKMLVDEASWSDKRGIERIVEKISYVQR